MKLGIVGNGKIVQEFCSIKERFGLSYISICGRAKSRDNILKLKETYELDRCFFDYEDFLNDDIDTVYIAVVNSLHYEYARQALEHGKHVIIEKPLTLCFSETFELYALARQKELMIWEAMTIPYLPAFVQLRKELAKGGCVKMAVFQYSQRSSRYDAFLRGEILPAFDPVLGGGALMDLNVYNVYAAVDLFGVPDRVVYHSIIEKNVDVNGTLLLKYPDFQVICIAAKDSASPSQSLIQCEHGTFVIQEPMNQMISYQFLQAKDTHDFQDTSAQHRMFHEFSAFIDFTDLGETQVCYQRFEKTLAVIKILEQARKSIQA